MVDEGESVDNEEFLVKSDQFGWILSIGIREFLTWKLGISRFNFTFNQTLVKMENYSTFHSF